MALKLFSYFTVICVLGSTFVNAQQQQFAGGIQEVGGARDVIKDNDSNPKNDIPAGIDVKNIKGAALSKTLETVHDTSVNKEKTLGFIHAFVASLSVIIVSELGDKTFFIAAIMAMRYSRVTVFTGAILALGIMTILSACLGFATTIIPRYITYYISTLLFAIFGIRMLHEGFSMRPDEGQEELEEVQAELKKKDEEMEKEAKTTLTQDAESGIVRGGDRVKRCWGLLSPILVQAFTLTFLAEWGDRSQLTTIILGARENVLGVVIGGTLGHALCTGLAVIGGRMIAQRISVRTVTIIGGVVFLLFAISSLIFKPDTQS